MIEQIEEQEGINEGDTCDCKNTEPMADWVNKPEKNPDMCHPCMIGLPANWYETELKEQGRADLAEELEQHRTGPDATADSVAAKMDDIKQRVDQPLRDRLLELDCMTQCADS